MTAYTWSIFDHPFFAVTKDDGKFTLANLPAGTYEIEAWHEKLGKKVEKVTVADSDTKTVDFKFSAPGSDSQTTDAPFHVILPVIGRGRTGVTMEAHGEGMPAEDARSARSA